jgi:hypothetical protein
MVCSTLQLENGSLPPLVQQNFYCEEKPDKPRKKKQGRQGKQKEKRETLIEAFYRHDDPSTNQPFRSKMGPFLALYNAVFKE